MAATPPKAKDPLDALQLLVNDVLVQTGKALRASRRDSQGNLSPSFVSCQPKLPDTIKAFHAALDDLERDIIQAKSTLLRDLNELKVHKEAQEKPAEQQSRSPMTIDLDSSPPAAPTEQLVIKMEPVGKPVAPFPDMGMSLPETSAAVKDEDTPTQASPAAPEAADGKTEGGAYSGLVGPIATAEQKPTVGQPNAPGADDTLAMSSGLNFTDMEFSLAPTNNESQDQLNGDMVNMNAAAPSFDLASFAPADGTDSHIGGTGNNVASLDNILPANLTGQHGAPTSADNQGKAMDSKTNELPDAAFADIFTGDGQADGMDFDFSLGDSGMGGDTFDDLMNDRDNPFDTIEHGD